MESSRSFCLRSKNHQSISKSARMSKRLGLIKTGQQWFVLSLDSPAFVSLQDGFQNQSSKKLPRLRFPCSIYFCISYKLHKLQNMINISHSFTFHWYKRYTAISIWCQKLNMFQLCIQMFFPFCRLLFAPQGPLHHAGDFRGDQGTRGFAVQP